MNTDRIPRERKFVFRSKTKSVEWVMTAFMLAWGLGLMVPGETFSMPAFRDFVEIGLEEADVATFYLVIGGIRSVTLFRNGSLTLGPEIRFLCSAIGSFTWLLSAILFALPSLRGAPLPVNAPIHFVMFGAEMYAIGVAAFDRGCKR